MTTQTTTGTVSPIKQPATRDEARDLLEREDIKIFENIDFLGADIESFTIKDRYFKNCDFSDAYMEDANFINCTFIDCDFTDALMAEAVIAHTTLTDCDLSNAELDYAVLNHAEFTRCDFTDTDFTDSMPAYVTFWKVKTSKGTDFTGFDFAGVTFDSPPYGGDFTPGTYHTLQQGGVRLLATSRGWHLHLSHCDYSAGKYPVVRRNDSKECSFIDAQTVNDILVGKEDTQGIKTLKNRLARAVDREGSETLYSEPLYEDIVRCVKDNSHIINELWGDITPIKCLQEEPTGKLAFYQAAELLYESTSEPIVGVDFSGHNLRGARIAWKYFEDCDFVNTRLCDAEISKCSFGNCDLSQAQFDRAIMKDTDIRRSNLHRAYFDGAQLKNSVFCCVKCGGTYLEGVDLAEVTLCDSLDGANFTPGTYHELKGGAALIATSKGWHLFHIANKYPFFIDAEDVEAIMTNDSNTNNLKCLQEYLDSWIENYEEDEEDTDATFGDIVQCVKDNSHIIAELWGDITPIKCLQKKPADHLTRKINDTAAQLAA